MEDTVKIIEEFLHYSNCDECEGASVCDDCYIERTQVKAVKELLKAYRNLEESNKILNDLYWNQCVPNSKIQERISKIDEDIEYQKQYGNTAKREKLEFEKEIYLELLEDKKMCDYCEKVDNEYLGHNFGNYILTLETNNLMLKLCNEHIEDYIKINYCPMCGRELGGNK